MLYCTLVLERRNKYFYELWIDSDYVVIRNPNGEYGFNHCNSYMDINTWLAECGLTNEEQTMFKLHYG